MIDQSGSGVIKLPSKTFSNLTDVHVCDKHVFSHLKMKRLHLLRPPLAGFSLAVSCFSRLKHQILKEKQTLDTGSAQVQTVTSSKI